MIEIICAGCKQPLQVEASSIGYATRLLVSGCGCEEPKNCDHCDKMAEIQEEIMESLMQAQIDIEGNDEMIMKIGKLATKYGGQIQKDIEAIMNS